MLLELLAEILRSRVIVAAALDRAVRIAEARRRTSSLSGTATAFPRTPGRPDRAGISPSGDRPEWPACRTAPLLRARRGTPTRCRRDRLCRPACGTRRAAACPCATRGSPTTMSHCDGLGSPAAIAACGVIVASMGTPAPGWSQATTSNVDLPAQQRIVWKLVEHLAGQRPLVRDVAGRGEKDAQTKRWCHVKLVAIVSTGPRRVLPDRVAAGCAAPGLPCILTTLEFRCEKQKRQPIVAADRCLTKPPSFAADATSALRLPSRGPVPAANRTSQLSPVLRPAFGALAPGPRIMRTAEGQARSLKPRSSKQRNEASELYRFVCSVRGVVRL